MAITDGNPPTPCDYFMHTSTYPQWGCRCCLELAEGGESHGHTQRAYTHTQPTDTD